MGTRTVPTVQAIAFVDLTEQSLTTSKPEASAAGAAHGCGTEKWEWGSPRAVVPAAARRFLTEPQVQALVWTPSVSMREILPHRSETDTGPRAPEHKPRGRMTDDDLTALLDDASDDPRDEWGHVLRGGKPLSRTPSGVCAAWVTCRRARNKTDLVWAGDIARPGRPRSLAHSPSLPLSLSPSLPLSDNPHDFLFWRIR